MSRKKVGGRSRHCKVNSKRNTRNQKDVYGETVYIGNICSEGGHVEDSTECGYIGSIAQAEAKRG